MTDYFVPKGGYLTLNSEQSQSAKLYFKDVTEDVVLIFRSVAGAVLVCHIDSFTDEQSVIELITSKVVNTNRMQLYCYGGRLGLGYDPQRPLHDQNANAVNLSLAKAANIIRQFKRDSIVIQNSDGTLQYGVAGLIVSQNLLGQDQSVTSRLTHLPNHYTQNFTFNCATHSVDPLEDPSLIADEDARKAALIDLTRRYCFSGKQAPNFDGTFSFLHKQERSVPLIDVTLRDFVMSRAQYDSLKRSFIHMEGKSMFPGAVEVYEADPEYRKRCFKLLGEVAIETNDLADFSVKECLVESCGSITVSHSQLFHAHAQISCALMSSPWATLIKYKPATKAGNAEWDFLKSKLISMVEDAIYKLEGVTEILTEALWQSPGFFIYRHGACFPSDGLDVSGERVGEDKCLSLSRLSENLNAWYDEFVAASPTSTTTNRLG